MTQFYLSIYVYIHGPQNELKYKIITMRFLRTIYHP